MKIDTIYLDMDGVLANFDERWSSLFNETPGTSRDRKQFDPNWKLFIQNQNFASLSMFPGAEDLLEFVSRYRFDLNIEILSSSGGKLFHNEVSIQKRLWLNNHGISYVRNFVPGRKLKKNYATPSTILIDDTPDVIEAFTAAGGIGILHTDANETIELLKGYLNESVTD